MKSHDRYPATAGASAATALNAIDEPAEMPAADNMSAITGGISASVPIVSKWNPRRGGRPLARTAAEGNSRQQNGAAFGSGANDAGDSAMAR